MDWGGSGYPRGLTSALLRRLVSLGFKGGIGLVEDGDKFLDEG